MHLRDRPAQSGERGDDVPVRFTSDGRSVFVGSFGKIPALLTKVDLSSGARAISCSIV